VFLFAGSSLFGQGNLQFNQVLLLDASTTGNAYSVPSGKVWKIENIACSGNNCYVQLQMSGLNYYLSNTSSTYNHLPFWLPTGGAYTLIGSSTAKVSIIEFNIVP
jgi:hypothetical protein